MLRLKVCRRIRQAEQYVPAFIRERAAHSGEGEGTAVYRSMPCKTPQTRLAINLWPSAVGWMPST
jgi:hypothetical protein